MAKKITPKSAEEIEKELNELTERVEQKIDAFFTSRESLIEHLRFLSQFHNYSVRNMMLIDDQFEGARAVGSFPFWKSKGVMVNKGEKGIKILVPTPVTYFQRGEDMVQLKYATATEKALIENGRLDTTVRNFFKIGHVFDYSQTNAREKGLEVSEIFSQFQINHTLENESEFMQALHKVADSIGVKILDEPYNELGTAKGAFYPFYNTIALNPRNTGAENVNVLIHELAHAQLHNLERNLERDKPLTTQEKEFQAELTAYTVAARYGIEVENFSVPYLANWTANATLKEKEKLIQEVKETASSFIQVMDKELEQLTKGLAKEQSKGFTQIGLVEYGALSDAKLSIVPYEKLHEVISNRIKEFRDKDVILDAISPAFEGEQFTQKGAQLINEQLKRTFHVFNPEDVKEPKALIQWTESDRFDDNTMYRFAEANHIAAEVVSIHNPEDGYFKTRYSVILPTDEGMVLKKTDRLDLGDGEFKDMQHQIYYEHRHFTENRFNTEELELLEKDLKAFYQAEKGLVAVKDLETFVEGNVYEKTAKMEAEKISAAHGDTLDKPIMKIHGVTANYMEFGEANQLPFDEIPEKKFDYTIAFQSENGINVMSSSFYMNQTITPLHDIEKFEKLPSSDVEKLAENWHEYLQKEEDKYLEAVMPRVRAEVSEHDQQQKKLNKSRTMELER